MAYGTAINNEKTWLMATLVTHPEQVSTFEVGGEPRLQTDSKTISGWGQRDKFQLEVKLSDQRVVTLLCERQKGWVNGAHPRWKCTNLEREAYCFCTRDANPKVASSVKHSLMSRKPLHLFVAVINGKKSDVDDQLRLPINLAVKTHYSNLGPDVLHEANVRLDYCSDDIYDGQSVLHLAVLGKRSVLIHALVAGGADLEQVNNSKETPLELAVKSGRTAESQALMKEGAVTQGRTLMQKALVAGNLSYPYSTDVAKSLLANGAKLDEQDSKQRTALLNMIIAGNEKGIIFALQNGASLGICDKNGHNALSAMVKSKQRVQYLNLVFTHCDIQGQQINSEPFKRAFEFAARCGYCNALQIFIDKGIEQTELPNEPFPSKELMAAAENRTDNACQLLLRDWFKKHPDMKLNTLKSTQSKVKFEKLLQRTDMGKSWSTYLTNTQDVGEPELPQKIMK
ncbi:ankyrin repeat domain-containing protein [Parashewanella curva]|uniref:Ankyrin repeat domain-containing protein n=1 Tax=Parashewanella curva TaxID=2338552 RepID=A0A3L8Q1B6_9GAMM|nr:ankyrin repeat domain-containing protein [Parashewanella curva]RLV61436.1 ankyrin repeat domain-containing protein [Parashewanella curva]